MRALLLTAALLGLSSTPNVLAQERSGRATHYGVGFHGRTMGCGGVYSTYNPTIIAVPPSMYRAWPCGTTLVVSGPNGAIVGTRQDSCPGCDSAGVIVDLSEAGHRAVCGVGTCWVTVRPYVQESSPAPVLVEEPAPVEERWDDVWVCSRWAGWNGCLVH